MRSSVKPHLMTLGLIALGALATAQAQDNSKPLTPEEKMQQAVLTRQSLFEVINFNSEQVMSMLKSKMVDAAVAQKVAGRLEMLAPMIPEVFATDTRKAPNVKTKAREGIWSSMGDFKARADDLAKAAQALDAAAKTGEKGATLKAIAGVGKACSGCHDNFRDK